MNLVNRNVVVITILFIVLFSTISGFVNFTENDNFPDYSYLQAHDFITSWTGMSNYQMISGLMMGMSICILLVVYQGSRLSHRRINGWDIDSVSLFWGVFSMTALIRAAFAFFSQQSVLQIKNKYLNKTSNPINDSLYEEVLNHAFHN